LCAQQQKVFDIAAMQYYCMIIGGLLLPSTPIDLRHSSSQPVWSIIKPKVHSSRTLGF
jgi:hypothetical protein